MRIVNRGIKHLAPPIWWRHSDCHLPGNTWSPGVPRHGFHAQRSPPYIPARGVYNGSAPRVGVHPESSIRLLTHRMYRIDQSAIMYRVYYWIGSWSRVFFLPSTQDTMSLQDCQATEWGAIRWDISSVGGRNIYVSIRGTQILYVRNLQIFLCKKSHPGMSRNKISCETNISVIPGLTIVWQCGQFHPSIV